jgi:putative protease
MERKIELLAPARDLEVGIAAIDSGADAVYIGAARFGARSRVGNSLADIKALVDYAHIYWARVYVTVNTLLHDDELPQAVRLLHQLYDIGVDAAIIQDVGLLECDLPPLTLVASTQMHNNTPEKVAFLERVGIQRVILARELSLKQIRAIRARTSLELEAFVHGALCVCYSGQCYMSYAIGGRSGNRGECAQPCRRRYSLVDALGQPVASGDGSPVAGLHLLSLRDLNLTQSLDDMLDAGITTFKIEGRLKDRGTQTVFLQSRQARQLS